MLVGFFSSLSKSQPTLCIYLHVKHSLHLPTLKTTGQSEQKTLDTPANPPGIYMSMWLVKNPRTFCEICPKLAIKTSERLQWRFCSVFVVNFGHISHFSCVSFVDFEPARNTIFWQKSCFWNHNQNKMNVLNVWQVTIKTPERRQWPLLVSFICILVYI